MDPTSGQAAALEQTLAPRFRLEGVLGQGGMGTVYRAVDAELGRRVALKVLTRLEGGAAGLARFQREAQIAGSLSHPGIVKVHSTGLAGASPWLSMELVAGAQTFDAALGPRDRRGRVELVRDAARALGHAHAQGVVHRDVKPGNLLVDEAGRVRVTDFGLATRADAERLTRTGAFVGTPFYMAPEQIRGDRAAVGAASDVYALGVVLYEALTDRRPHAEARTLAELVVAVSTRDPRPPREVDRSVPPELDAVGRRALAREPAARYADADELARDLDAWLGGGRVSATTGSRVSSWLRGPRSRRRLLLAAPPLVAAAALVAVLHGTAGPSPERAAAADSPTPREPPAGPPPSPGPPTPAEAPPAPEPAAVGELLFFHDDRGDEVAARFLTPDRALTWSGDALAVWDLAGEAAGPRGRWSPFPGHTIRTLTLAGADRALVVGLGRRDALRFGWIDLASGAVEEIALPGVRRLNAVDLAGEPGARTLVLAGETRRVYVFRERGGAWRAAPPLGPFEAPVRRAALAGDRVVVASGSGSFDEVSRVRVVGLDDGGERTHHEILSRPSAMAWSRDRAVFAVGTAAGRVIVVRPRGPAPSTQELPLPLGRDDLDAQLPDVVGLGVKGLAVSPEGGTLYAVCAGSGLTGEARAGLRAWDLAEGREVWRRRLALPASDLDVSPDGRRLLVGGEAGRVLVLPAAPE